MASVGYREANTNKPWEVRYREHGADRRKAFKLKSQAKEFKREAEKIEADAITRSSGPPLEVLNRKLEEQWQRWKDTRVDLAQATRDKDKWVWNAWLEPALGNRRIGSIDHTDLNKIMGEISESGAGHATRVAVYTRLCMVLDDALGPGEHSCRRVKVGTPQRQRDINLLTDEEITKLLDCVREEWRVFVNLLATMGLRPHEACMLRGRDVNPNNATINVRTKKGRKEAMRVLPLPDHLETPVLARASEVERDDPLWFVSNWNNWRKRVWLPAVEKAGLEEVVPYDLRHTAASKLISAGASPNDVAEWMGHSVEICLKLYSHLFPGRKRELAGILSRPA